jgi:very-short-patch-repair endonuclease
VSVLPETWSRPRPRHTGYHHSVTNPTLTQAVRAAVERVGYQPGTALENSVALALARANAPHARQQYSAGKYRLDFAWPQRKMALEADGWWHRSPEGAAKDRLRDSWLRSQGWIVFRVDDEHGDYLLNDQVARVAGIVEREPEEPPPPPPPRPNQCEATVQWSHLRCKQTRSKDGPYCVSHARMLGA